MFKIVLEQRFVIGRPPTTSPILLDTILPAVTEPAATLRSTELAAAAGSTVLSFCPVKDKDNRGAGAKEPGLAGPAAPLPT